MKQSLIRREQAPRGARQGPSGSGLAFLLALTLSACATSEEPSGEPAGSPTQPGETNAGFVLQHDVAQDVGSAEPALDVATLGGKARRKDKAAHAKHLLLLVESDGKTFDVLRAKEVAAPLPPSKRVAQSWEVRAQGTDGSVLSTVSIHDPHEVHAEFGSEHADDDAEAHVHLERETAVFSVRVPVDSRGLEFIERATSAKGVDPSVPAKLAAPSASGDTLLGQSPISPDMIERL